MLVVFTLTQVLVSLAFAGLVKVTGGAPFGHKLSFSTALDFALPLSVGASHVVGWLAIYYLVVKRHGMAFVAGLALGKYPIGRINLAFLGGIGIQVLVVVALVFLPPPEDFRNPLEQFVRRGGWNIAFLVVLAVGLAPLLEEALFRGLLLPALRARFNFAISALAVTLLFTLLHATQTGKYLPGLAGIAVCGFFLAVLREKSGSLWPSVAFHMGFNFTALLPVMLLV